ncbi:MAG: TonB-dependent receptor plug domain-containing protein [Muribaculaceae bacterium]|nr:TonB-dependent receptor plug domain-containing protein [Muribaculaceae bacterium]
MKRVFISFMLAAVAGLTLMASEPFIGTVRNTRGRAMKGVKVYVTNPKKAVKSDKKGEFRFDNITPGDSIHVIYNKKIHGFAVNDRRDVMLVVGEDGRIFERDNYVGDSFHGHLVDYKGKPIRGAVVYTTDPFDYVKSNSEGKFLIDNIVETDTIHVKHDGYIHDIAMDGSKGMFIKIMRNTGRRAETDLVNTGAGLVDARYYNGPRAVMTEEQLERVGTQNLAEAMSGMRGVTVVRVKNGEYAVQVRGGSPLWIVDGVRMNGTPELMVVEIKQIEVLHDGGLFGIGGFGGVVNITTKGSEF